MYGIIICTGILISSLLGEKIIKDKKLDPNNYWSAVFFVIVFGVIGARLYHVIDYWEIYSRNTDLIWRIDLGGLGIYGAVFGGLLAATIYLILKREPVSAWLDIAAIVTPIGQAIGRWGNFVNQELYGIPTSLPFGIYIEKPIGGFKSGLFHPLFLYESILNFLLFFILWRAYKKGTVRFGSGLLLVVYLLGYGIIRFWLEFLRIDPWSVGGLNVAQIISVLLIDVCVLALMKSKIKAQAATITNK